MTHTTFMKGEPMGFTKLGFSGQRMKYPLNALFGMVVGEQNTGKSYLFQSNPDAFIINLDLSSTVTPECRATIWPGVDDAGLPIDIDNKHLVLTWDKVLEKKQQLIDMAKAAGAGTSGVGVWDLHLSQILQISISVACLIYLVTKIVFLIRNKGK